MGSLICKGNNLCCCNKRFLGNSNLLDFKVEAQITQNESIKN